MGNAARKAIGKILGGEIAAYRRLKHHGSGIIFVFKVRGDARTYLLKSYRERKFGRQEAKNLQLIKHIQLISKPTYFGSTNGFFVQEYIKGSVFQDRLNKNRKADTSAYFTQAVLELVKIHTAASAVKQPTALRSFTEVLLEKRIRQAIRFIKNIGFPAYHKLSGRINPAWSLALENISIDSLVATLRVNGREWFLGHGDYKPNNLIFDATGRLWVLDWLGMARAQPWYDLAYLLLQAKPQEKYLRLYLARMHGAGYLKKVSFASAKKLFKQGVIFQQLIRAKSNAPNIKTGNDRHYIREFKRSMDGLVAVLASAQ